MALGYGRKPYNTSPYNAEFATSGLPVTDTEDRFYITLFLNGAQSQDMYINPARTTAKFVNTTHAVRLEF